MLLIFCSFNWYKKKISLDLPYKKLLQVCASERQLLASEQAIVQLVREVGKVICIQAMNARAHTSQDKRIRNLRNNSRDRDFATDFFHRVFVIM